MNIIVAIMTYNPFEGLRDDLVRQCVESALRAFPNSTVEVHDNCSTDGSIGFLASLGVDLVSHCSDNHTPGHGRNMIMETIQEDTPDEYDVVVFSDDDMLWKKGAEVQLSRIWSKCPSDIMIVSGLLEPVWAWNTPRETVRCGSGDQEVPVLVRDSCPGAAWSFKLDNWKDIGPVKDDWGYDYDTCQRLAKNNLRVAQVDLADHAGWQHSMHGNSAIEHIDTKPLDRKKWGV